MILVQGVVIGHLKTLTILLTKTEGTGDENLVNKRRTVPLSQSVSSLLVPEVAVVGTSRWRPTREEIRSETDN